MVLKLKKTSVYRGGGRLWVALATMAVAASAYCTDCVWLNDEGGAWGTSSNWKDGIVPTAHTDTADFSVLTGEKTVTVSSPKVGAIIYAPAVGDTTNTLILAGATTLKVAYSVTVGEKAVLVTECTLFPDIDANNNRNFYKYGPGTLRAEGKLYKNGSVMHINHIEGTVIMAKEGDAGVTGLFYRSGSNDPSSAPASFFIESGATVTVSTSTIGSWGIGTNEGSRASFTINGGKLDATTFKNTGCLINADGAGSVCTLNVVNGGLLDGGTNKTFYVSNNGTGTLNQVDSIIACKDLYMSGGPCNGMGTYNFKSGELWLNHVVYCGHPDNAINIGNSKIVGTSAAVSFPYCESGGTGYDALTTIGERLEIAVTNEAFTFTMRGKLAGPGALVKTGPGLLQLHDKEKHFTGPLVVSNGTAYVSTPLRGSNDVTVASGALLKVRCNSSTSYLDPESAIDMAADARIELEGSKAVTVRQLAIGGKLKRGRGCKYGSSDHVLDVDVVDDVHFSGTGILVVRDPVYRGSRIILR